MPQKFEMEQDINDRGLQKLLTSLGLKVDKKQRADLLAVSHRTRRERINKLLEAKSVDPAGSDLVAGNPEAVQSVASTIKASVTKVVNKVIDTANTAFGTGQSSAEPVLADTGSLTVIKSQNNPDGRPDIVLPSLTRRKQIEHVDIKGMRYQLANVIDGLNSTKSYVVLALAESGMVCVRHLNTNRFKVKFYQSPADLAVTEAQVVALGGYVSARRNQGHLVYTSFTMNAEILLKIYNLLMASDQIDMIPLRTTVHLLGTATLAKPEVSYLEPIVLKYENDQKLLAQPEPVQEIKQLPAETGPVVEAPKERKPKFMGCNESGSLIEAESLKEYLDMGGTDESLKRIEPKFDGHFYTQTIIDKPKKPTVKAKAAAGAKASNKVAKKGEVVKKAEFSKRPPPPPDPALAKKKK